MQHESASLRELLFAAAARLARAQSGGVWDEQCSDDGWGERTHAAQPELAKESEQECK